MTSILSEVLKDAERLFESAIVVTAFSLMIFGLEHKHFEDRSVKLYEKSNPSLAMVMKKVR